MPKQCVYQALLTASLVFLSTCREKQSWAILEGFKEFNGLVAFIILKTVVHPYIKD
jgi:hypothetical protein